VGLAYDRAGSGPALVLLHGVGHRRQAWDAVLDRLTPHRDVIAVDLSGHGDSPPLQLAGRPVLEAMLDDVRDLLAALGVDRPHYAGNSLGGRLALEAGASGAAASATALSPAGFWRTGWEFRYARTIFSAMQASSAVLRPLAPAILGTTAGRALTFSAVVARPGRLTAEQATGDVAGFVRAREALDAVLAGMGQFTSRIPDDLPVTIGWGTKDRLLPQRQVLVARARLPQATFVPLPGCGHVPMTDDPALVADVLLRGSGG
jgi:pimeloyl-ACP methyl ester carboxylesterase